MFCHKYVSSHSTKLTLLWLEQLLMLLFGPCWLYFFLYSVNYCLLSGLKTKSTRTVKNIDMVQLVKDFVISFNEVEKWDIEQTN